MNLRSNAWRTTLLGCLLAIPLALASQESAEAGVHHVIHISVDGLRGDFLQTRIQTSPLLYPNFKRFVDEGATTFNARTDYTYSDTLPNHTSMITGRPVTQPAGMPNTTHHGYIDNGTPDVSATLHNSGNPNLTYVASTFDVVHDNGLSTALYASKDKFVIYDQSYRSTTGGFDVTGPDNGRDKINDYVYLETGSPENASNLQAAYLTALAANDFNYTFLHYRDPDSAGHSIGWGTPAWDTAVKNVDGYLGGLFNLIANDPGLAGDTAIVLTADHGGSGTGHGDATQATNYTIPVLVWGPGVTAGADLYALNPTTRLNPGTGRPSYTAAGQPIRNGDTGNLALDLLGLGPVPGSLINNSQNLQVPEPSSGVLAALAGLAMLGWRRRRKRR